MMKVALAFVSAFTLSLTVTSAYAVSRVVDGFVGAGAGALVAGPVGLLAGGVIGYSAGPHISCAVRGDCHRWRRDRPPNA
ncbi:hypothetical protein [Rhodoblastus sp.]|uniref:hypothetical protein n=1 Tax=Rhodoblastus sp. TaxID=1962975 RepID=UPI0026218E2F|nr:hypothetical protein [Rhodoblastus sp.]